VKSAPCPITIYQGVLDWVQWLTPIIPAGGGDGEDCISRPDQRDPHLKKKNLGMVTHTCHPSYVGSINRRITVQAGMGINVSPILKSN
jgi:hypothetical protein